MIKDYITAEERLSDPYAKQIWREMLLAVVCFGLVVTAVYQFIVDITN